MATKVVNLSETNLTCFFLNVFRQHSSQSITVSVVSCVVTSLFAYTAVMANGATMLVIWKTRELHSPSLTLMFCLAFSDFLVGLLGQPLFVAFKSAELLGKFDAYCKLRLSQFFIGWITGSLSFVIVSGVSFDRLHVMFFETPLPIHGYHHSSKGANTGSISIGMFAYFDSFKAVVERQLDYHTRRNTFSDVASDCRKYISNLPDCSQTSTSDISTESNDGSTILQNSRRTKMQKVGSDCALYLWVDAGILSSVYFSRHEWSNIRCYTVSYSRLWRCHSHSFYKLVVKSFHLLLENGTNTICCQKYS